MAEHYDENLILGYIEGELSGSALKRFEADLAREPRLRALVDAVVADRNALRALPDEQPPFDLMERITQRLERDMLLGGDEADEEEPAVAGRIGGWSFSRWAAVGGVAALLALSTMLVYETLMGTSSLNETMSERKEGDEFAVADSDGLAGEQALKQGDLRVAETRRGGEGVSDDLVNRDAVTRQMDELSGDLAKKQRDASEANETLGAAVAMKGAGGETPKPTTSKEIKEAKSGEDFSNERPQEVGSFAKLTRNADEPPTDAQPDAGQAMALAAATAGNGRKQLQDVVDGIQARYDDEAVALASLQSKLGNIRHGRTVYLDVPGDTGATEVELQAWARRRGAAFIPDGWLDVHDARDATADQAATPALAKADSPDETDEPFASEAAASRSAEPAGAQPQHKTITLLVPIEQLPELEKQLAKRGRVAIDATPAPRTKVAQKLATETDSTEQSKVAASREFQTAEPSVEREDADLNKDGRIETIGSDAARGAQAPAPAGGMLESAYKKASPGEQDDSTSVSGTVAAETVRDGAPQRHRPKQKHEAVGGADVPADQEAQEDAEFAEAPDAMDRTDAKGEASVAPAESSAEAQPGPVATPENPATVDEWSRLIYEVIPLTPTQPIDRRRSEATEVETVGELVAIPLIIRSATDADALMSQSEIEAKPEADAAQEAMQDQSQ